MPPALIVMLSKDKFAVEEDARHEVERLGGDVRPMGDTKDAFRYAVWPKEPQAQFIAKLEQKGIAFRMHREEVRTTLGAIHAIRGEGLAFGAPGKTAFSDGVDFASVESIQLEAPISIPQDAWIVVENERPEDFRWALAVDAVLALFLLFNGWLLTRSLRDRKTAA
jgi:hypothetical protein